MDKKELKGGVLIIGSLLWHDLEIRNKWRDENLDLKKKILIKVPIRYGRFSESQNNTYTMVFSSECLESDKLGTAWFVPFKNKKLNFHQIKAQCENLIDAEYKKQKSLNCFNWGWGCIGYSKNSEVSEDKQEVLKEIWNKNLSQRFDISHYKIGEEKPILNKQGVLKISWPKELKDYDFLITTLTKPERNAYPNLKEIVDAMTKNNYYKYFKTNIKSGINTFQDKEIKEQL